MQNKSATISNEDDKVSNIFLRKGPFLWKQNLLLLSVLVNQSLCKVQCVGVSCVIHQHFYSDPGISDIMYCLHKHATTNNANLIYHVDECYLDICPILSTQN